MGRLELLRWLNDFLQTDYTKIEHLKDGVAYCQIFDAAFPGKVPLNKLNFNPQHVEDHVKNLRILDQSFRTLKIPKEISAVKIAQGNFQENYDFLQWCINYIQKVAPNCKNAYRPYERRLEAQQSQTKSRKSMPSSASTTSFPTASAAPPHSSHGPMSVPHSPASHKHPSQLHHNMLPNRYAPMNFHSRDSIPAYDANAYSSHPDDFDDDLPTHDHMHQPSFQYASRNSFVDLDDESDLPVHMSQGSFRTAPHLRTSLSSLDSMPIERLRFSQESIRHSYSGSAFPADDIDYPAPEAARSPMNPEEVDDLTQNLQSDLESRLEALQRIADQLPQWQAERDFYFSKLLNIEETVKSHPNANPQLLLAIESVLFDPPSLPAIRSS